MALISLIAAIDEARGLGINNQLLCYLPADLKHFKDVTMGKPIIMGRKTFESIGRPLPGRLNIVLSNTATHIEGTTVVHSLEDALSMTQNEPEVMIIGGANLYSQAISVANRLYVTHIHHHFDADVFFPEISELEWLKSEDIERSKDEANKYDLTFSIYNRK